MIIKFSLLFAVFLFLTGCFSDAAAVLAVSETAQPAPTVVNSNSDNVGKSYVDYEFDHSLFDRLNKENEKFRQIPEVFKNVDFKNFKYDFGRMKNGEYEMYDPKRKSIGGGWYDFNDVFYVDLIGDAKKEAVVMLYEVHCGGSCDGGRHLVHFYSSDKGAIKRFAVLETGSHSGGCGLKSFTVKDKKLYIEQFGRCIKNPTFDYYSESVCKFCIKDETHSVYSIAKNGLKRESAKIIETEMVNIMNSPTYISIEE